MTQTMMIQTQIQMITLMIMKNITAKDVAPRRRPRPNPRRHP